MSYYPWAKLGCVLEINPEQVRQYIGTCPSFAPCGRISVACNCPVLRFNEDLSPRAWTTPAGDGAEWYDPDYPISGGFLGFMVESVEEGYSGGLYRSLTPRATSAGGSSIGGLRPKAREMKFSLLAFACNESAMEYGMRFLVDSLAGNQCDDCSLCDMRIRTSCPPVVGATPTAAEFDVGLWELYDTAVVDGPRWGTPPLDSYSCYVRRIEFTIVAQTLWLNKCPVTCADNVPIASPVSVCDFATFCAPSRVCCLIDEKLTIGETAVVVTIKAVENLENVVISGTYDPYGVQCAGGTAVNTPCFTLTIPYIEAGTTITFDSAREKITATIGDKTFDGTPYLSTSPETSPEWFVVKCGKYCVCVEANRTCLGSASSSTVTISSIHRER